MKKLLCLFGLVATIVAGSISPASGQELVTTGMVQSMNPQTGLLVVHSDQTNAPVSFTGLDKTNIFTVDGKPALLSDLTMGTKVTVQYGKKGGALFVSKIIFGDASAAGTTAAPAAAPAGVVPRSGTNPTGYPDPKGGVAPLNTTGAPSTK